MIIDVAVPFRVGSSFHYKIEPEHAATITSGSLVQVPFRNRSTHAFVLGFPKESDVDPGKLKTVEGVLVTEPLFDAGMLEFLRWVSEYYCHPLGEVMAAAIPKPTWAPTQSKRPRKSKVDSALEGLTPLSTEKPILNDEQRAALTTINDALEKRPILLHGVTGSGKTEVYMHALESVLDRGKGAIILVPEIALTPQLVGRFSARFPGLVALLHSDLTPRDRAQQWERVRKGEARIVIGARSAVFAPIRDLGIIVVDEEHESSFKQEDSLRYHGRDIAIVRGRMAGARVVLGSATPSLESYANAQSGKYVYSQLKSRVQRRGLPKTTFVDLKDPQLVHSPQVPWLSEPLIARMGEVLRAGHQSLLYLNRLGFAHFLFCQDCGHSWHCRNCDVSLTYYQNPPTLKCHYCGVFYPPPKVCEKCSGIDLRTMGVGTEQVEKTLRGIFPDARIARMDRSVIKNRKDLETILNQIARHQVDIAIGTQMIAKGHDFPGIALVGILLADASLNLPDFRAHEKTFQIITQVSGRAGRADIAGEVMIQTVNPKHPVLLAAAENRAEDFYRFELDARRQFGFPPFQRLAMLRFQHRQQIRVRDFACDVAAQIQRRFPATSDGCHIIGPSEAPLSRLKNLYRWQCLVKSESVRNLRRVLHFVNEYAAYVKSPVTMAVDVDPINAL